MPLCSATAQLYAHGEPSQSHVKYPSPSWWVEQFLARLFSSVFFALRPAGYFLVNISNNRMLIEGSCDLERATCDCAQAAGFMEEPTLRMLKPRCGTAETLVDDATSEPIFVFRKPPAAAHTAHTAHAPPPTAADERVERGARTSQQGRGAAERAATAPTAAPGGIDSLLDLF